MHQAASAYDGEVVYVYLSGQLRGIADDDVVFQYTIMGNVTVSHDKAMASNDGFPLGGCSPINGDTFPDCCMMPDFRHGLLSDKFQILRNSGDNGSRKYLAIIPDPGSFQNGGMWKYPAIIAYYDIFFDNNKGIYRNMIPYTGFGMNDG
jgi:hypothetical protein